MNRDIVNVIGLIVGQLPNPAPPEVEKELIVLQAELSILMRTAMYQPPEASVQDLWNRLATALYRYLPDPASYNWAQAISNIARGLGE